MFSGTDLWHVNLHGRAVVGPALLAVLRHRRRQVQELPNPSLVGAPTTNAKLANAGVGVRYYLTERFVMRADYSLYTAFVSDQKTTEYRAWTVGLSFFF